MQSSNIRVRLLFDDCTPSRPGSVGRRKCWFLLNVGACRRVTDVEYCIRETFCLGKTCEIELLVDDFMLPPFEKSEIIKENDLIRVRLLNGEPGPEAHRQINSSSSHHSNKKKSKNSEIKHSLNARVHPQEHENVPSTSTAKKTISAHSAEGDPHKRKNCNTNKVHKNIGVVNGEANLKEHTGNGTVIGKRRKTLTNGTPKHLKAVEHQPTFTKSVPASRKRVSSKVHHQQQSSSSSSDSEDEGQSAVLRARHQNSIGGRRKATRSKSFKLQSSRKTDSLHSSVKGDTLKKVLVGKAIPKASSGKVARSRSKPSESDSESSSTDAEAITKKKPQGQSANTVLPTKKLSSGGLGNALSKGKSQLSSSSSSSDSEASTLSSPDSDDQPISSLKPTQTNAVQGKPGIPAAPVATTNTQIPDQTNGKATGVTKSTFSADPRYAAVKKSKKNSSDKHVRFSSDSESEKSDTEVQLHLQPSVPPTLPNSGMLSELPKQRNNASTTSSLKETLIEIGPKMPANSEHLDEVDKADDGGNMQEQSIPDGDVPTPENINDHVTTVQGKLLSIAGQTPKRAKPKDYSSFPPLVGPPRVGDVIGYKILELSSSYTPEVSAYKEGEVINFNHSTSMIEVKLRNMSMAAEPKKNGGKFEMEEEAGDSSVPHDNNAVSRLVLVTLPSLIEPKLIT